MTGGSEGVCPNKATCAMYSLFTMAGTLRIWQDNYCNTAFDRCERYKRTERGERVPKELMPNGKTLTVQKK